MRKVRWPARLNRQPPTQTSLDGCQVFFATAQFQSKRPTIMQRDLWSQHRGAL